jgi:glycosyl transferase family 87
VRRHLPLILVLLAALAGALRGVHRTTVSTDFLRYHRAGRLVLQGRADLIYDAAFLAEQSVYAAEREPDGDPLREYEFKYAPALAVMMAPLSALPPRAASVLWLAGIAACIAWMFVVAWRWCGDGLSAWGIVLPLVVLARPVSDNVQLGQLNAFSIVPAAVGLAFVARGRERAGGALIGLGAAVKYMPALLFLWLAWRRRWTALAWAAAAILALGVVLPAAVLGPRGSVDRAREWIDARSHVYTSATPRDVPGYSAKSFVYRALGDTPYITNVHEVEVKRDAPHLSLDPDTLRATVVVVDLALFGAALWLTRRREDADTPEAAALWLAALPLVSPEARFPHFLYLALPLVALTCALARSRGEPRWRTAFALSAAGALLLNGTFKTLWGEWAGGLAEFYCAPGWAVIAFGAALAITMSMRRSTARPPAVS